MRERERERGRRWRDGGKYLRGKKPKGNTVNLEEKKTVVKEAGGVSQREREMDESGQRREEREMDERECVRNGGRAPERTRRKG